MVSEWSSLVRAVDPPLVAFVCCCEQGCAQVFCGAPAGLDRMAVRAERDHLYGVVASTTGEVVDVVDFQDRLAANGDVGCGEIAGGVLTPPPCAAVPLYGQLRA
jgi:hypothetical protein